MAALRRPVFSAIDPCGTDATEALPLSVVLVALSSILLEGLRGAGNENSDLMGEQGFDRGRIGTFGMVPKLLAVVVGSSGVSSSSW